MAPCPVFICPIYEGWILWTTLQQWTQSSVVLYTSTEQRPVHEFVLSNAISRIFFWGGGVRVGGEFLPSFSFSAPFLPFSSPSPTINATFSNSGTHYYKHVQYRHVVVQLVWLTGVQQVGTILTTSITSTVIDLVKLTHAPTHIVLRLLSMPTALSIGQQQQQQQQQGRCFLIHLCVSHHS